MVDNSKPEIILMPESIKSAYHKKIMDEELKNWQIEKKESTDKDIWVKIIAHIRKNDTGEIRQYETFTYWDEDNNEPGTFVWEEGNYSCDCNRQLFFQRAEGEDEDWDIQCGENKYDVNLQNPKTGEYFYKEF